MTAKARPLPPVIEAAKKRDIAAMLKRLSYKEREILKLRYGLTQDGLRYTLEEVGHIFKVTRERIRGIERKALAKLEAMKADEPGGVREWIARQKPQCPDPLAATVLEIRAGAAALDACRLLTQWAADHPDLPDGLDVIVRAAWDAVLAGEPRCYRPPD